MIAGPTASGKSSLALQLAAAFSGEIVSCDSVQIYKGLDIGSAKLSPSEQGGIRHHLLDLLEPDQLFTAGEFMEAGRRILNEIRRRGHLPILVGGTGLYLRALLEGLFKGPKRSEPLRQRFRELAQRRGTPGLHRLLKRVDPLSAGRISLQDLPKLIRALEVYWLTSQPLSSQFQSGKESLQGFEILKIGLNPPRAELYAAINQRVEGMFQRGLVDEVQRLVDAGWSKNLKPMQSLGYAQVIAFLEGQLTREAALAETQQGTRRYAKRQLTWFRKEKDIWWVNQFGNNPQACQLITSKVAAWLAGLGFSFPQV